MGDLPGSVLFACTLNAVRSPMAEALLKQLHGKHVFVDSVGVRPDQVDPFAVETMAEMGLGGRMNFAEIGGMPVRTKDGSDPAEVVASISHDSVPASLFATPAGFKQKKLDLE